MNRRRENNEEFERMWNDGAPLTEIAAKFGYSRTASVSGRARDMGLKSRQNPNETAERNRQIFNAHLDGQSKSIIAKRFGISVKRVSDIVQDLSERHPTRTQPSVDDTRVLAWSASPAAIAKALAKHQGLRA